MTFPQEKSLKPTFKKVRAKNKYLEKVEPTHLNQYFYISYSFSFLYFCVL